MRASAHLKEIVTRRMQHGRFWREEQKEEGGDKMKNVAKTKKFCCSLEQQSACENVEDPSHESKFKKSGP
jgi:hypothetical protein